MNFVVDRIAGIGALALGFVRAALALCPASEASVQQ
jgi:hypothetical protein